MKALEDDLPRLNDEHPGIWYVAEFEVPDQRVPEDPPGVAAFPGLLFYYYRDHGDLPLKVVSYWASRADFIASRRPFQWKLGLSSPVPKGNVQSSVFRRKPFWKRITLYGILLHTVAVLGALATLEKHYASLLEAPNLVVDLGGSETHSVGKGASLRLPMTIKNRSRTVQAEIQDVQVMLKSVQAKQPDQSLTVESLPPPIPEGGKEDLVIEGPAVAPGKYELIVTPIARAGWWPGFVPGEPKRKEVKVWAAGAVSQITGITENVPASRGAWLESEVELGKTASHGITCRVRIFYEPGIEFGLLDFPAARAEEPSYHPAVIYQDWTTVPLEKFKVYKFRMVLRGKPQSSWEKVKTNSVITCSVEKEEIR